jgi:hypothetical protein
MSTALRYVHTYVALRFTELRCASGTIVATSVITSCHCAALFIAFGPSVNCNVFQRVHKHIRCASLR